MMSDQNPGIEQLIGEVQELKDLFVRRLMDDKVKAIAIDQLAANNERLLQEIKDMHFSSFIKELILICDRIEAKSDANDFELSIREELLEVFERRGIRQIGENLFFDPTIHNAVKTVPATEDNPNGSIVGIVRIGYRQEKRVIRPADVVVATTNSNVSTR